MDSIDITFHKPAYRLTAAAQALSLEHWCRISNPQDLDDGLLAVAHDEILAEASASMEQSMEARLLESLGLQPACTASAAAVQNPAPNSHFSANPADLTAFLLSSTDQPRWLSNP